jgi:hypothetical protein
MWKMREGSDDRFNILKSFFSNLTVNLGIVNIHLPFGENSLTAVKNATRDALMRKDIKLK